VLPEANVTIAFLVSDLFPRTPLNLFTLPLSKIVLTDLTFTENIFSIEDFTSNLLALIGTENTILLKGKVKRFKGVLGKRSDTKKAIVTLAAGNTIDLSVGV